MARRPPQHGRRDSRKQGELRASLLAAVLIVGATAGVGVVTGAFGLSRLWADDAPERALRAWPWQALSLIHI